ncbi:MAG: response regulator [Verrucomicrobia bacterium]|nr:response regulator [Verrucomicrobiota bacterium]
MNPLILCVDDDPNVLASLVRGLRKYFTVHTALSGAEALSILQMGGPYAAILSDMRMPEMDGLEFLAKAAVLAPDTVAAMLTGNVDQITAVEALNSGRVHRFITKPASTETIEETLQACCSLHEELCAKRGVLERAMEGGVSLLREVYQSAGQRALAGPDLLMDYVSSFFYNIHPNQKTPREIEVALMLRYVGSSSLPGSLMQRAAMGEVLSPSEGQLIHSAAASGIQLLYGLPGMEAVARILHYQNKGFDGSGPPEDSLQGEALPFGSRLLRVMSDLLDLEKTGLKRHDALMRMAANAKRYDPEILKLCRLRWQFDRNIQLRRVPKPVLLSDLCVSDILAKPLYSKDSQLVALEGTVMTETLLRQIRILEQNNNIPKFLEINLLERIA